MVDTFCGTEDAVNGINYRTWQTAKATRRGIAQGGFQRSVLKSLLRREPLHRCLPAFLAGGQRARRGGNPPAPAFPRRGKREKGAIRFPCCRRPIIADTP